MCFIKMNKLSHFSFFVYIASLALSFYLPHVISFATSNETEIFDLYLEIGLIQLYGLLCLLFIAYNRRMPLKIQAFMNRELEISKSYLGAIKYYLGALNRISFVDLMHNLLLIWMAVSIFCIWDSEFIAEPMVPKKFWNVTYEMKNLMIGTKMRAGSRHYS